MGTLLYLIHLSRHKKVTLLLNGIINLGYSAYFLYALLNWSQGGMGLVWWFYFLIFTVIHWILILLMIVYLVIKNQSKPSYPIMQKESVTLIGLKLNTKTTNANGQATTDCGTLWQRFISQEVADKINNKSLNDIYAVYFDYDGDHTQPYSFFIGCPVATDAQLPEGLDTITIPNQQYTTVTAKGKMPNCIAKAWNDIWQSDINRAYGYDFEVYNELSADWQNAEIAIYLSVK